MSKRVQILRWAVVICWMGMGTSSGWAKDWENFGAVGDDFCSSPVSIDGDWATFVGWDPQNYTAPLYYYSFNKKQAYPTGIEGVETPNIKGSLIAYRIRLPRDPNIPYYTPYALSVYDIATGTVTDTGIRTAESRNWLWENSHYFDGHHIAFRDLVDGHLKIYSLATGTITDTRIEGWTGTLDGNYMAFEAQMGNGDWGIGLYDLTSGQFRWVDTGEYPSLAGNIVSYLGNNSELKYYDIAADTIVATGLTEVTSHDTDGDLILADIYSSSMVVFDIKKGTVRDTGHYPCSYSDSCWLEISGKYIAYERYEGGTEYWDPVSGAWTQVYPPTDYDGNGDSEGGCVALWFKF